MNNYFGIKYVDDFSNRHVIESILFVLESNLGIKRAVLSGMWRNGGVNLFRLRS